ncbi:toprim domain-containing protein [Aliihoeflea sp. PC F10.4]
MRHEPLKDRAVGRWHGILSGVGIPSKMLRNKHGPCPTCGGKDRFRFDDKGGRGTWICSHCGAGDGIELVKQFLRCDFRAAAVEIERHIGTSPVIAANGQPAQDDQKTRDLMRKMWERAQPLDLQDAAGRYINARTGLINFPTTLRFAKDERYSDAGQRASWHPALLAKVDPCDAAIADGERAALHRTYLDGLGDKADLPTPRKMMGSMPTGAAVRLSPAASTMGIAEGIETALSASILFNIPVWAALTAGLLQDWLPPAVARTVFIFGDNDHSHTGQAAAFALAQRLKAKDFDPIVQLPPRTGEDWNDVLKAKGKAA